MRRREGGGALSDLGLGLLRVMTNAWLLFGGLMLLLAFSGFHHHAIYAQYSISSSSPSLVMTETNALRKELKTQTSSSSNSSTSSSLMIHNDNNDNKQNDPILKSNSSSSSNSSDVRKIPHRFIFTYHSNILESKSPQLYYENVMNTIQMYRQAWNKEDGINEDDAEPPDVWFLNDQDCLEIIDKVEPALRRHFQMESRGDFKGDICRVVALYDRGGYYFDVDMLVVQALSPLAPHIRFASALCQGDYFFQSFLASEAHSPIINQTIHILRRYYDEKVELERDFLNSNEMASSSLQQVIAKHEGRLDMKVGGINITSSRLSPYQLFKMFEKRNNVMHMGENTELLGVGTLRTAYRQVVLAQDGGDGVVDKNDTFLLEEAFLTPELYPNLTRQAAHKGPYCNYIVHHPQTQQVYFFSRFDNTPKCH